MNNRQNKSNSLVPLVLSGLVCPGVGQCAQRRWFVGGLLFLLFLAAACWMLKLMGIYIVTALHYLVSLGNAPEPHAPIGRILASLGLAVLIYGISLADVIWAERRRKKNLPDAVESK